MQSTFVITKLLAIANAMVSIIQLLPESSLFIHDMSCITIFPWAVAAGDRETDIQRKEEVSPELVSGQQSCQVLRTQESGASQMWIVWILLIRGKVRPGKIKVADIINEEGYFSHYFILSP